jgi:hypothetical protein
LTEPRSTRTFRVAPRAETICLCHALTPGAGAALPCLQVSVTSRSYDPLEPAHVWTSTGAGSYNVGNIVEVGPMPVAPRARRVDGSVEA